MIETRDFKLDRWAREARELATCVVCFGVGERPADDSLRWGRGRTCEVCVGRGKAAREPHVLELVAMVRASDAEIAQLARDRYEEQGRAERAKVRADRAEVETSELRLEVDRLRGDLCRLRAELHHLRAGRPRGRWEE